jgi:predicted metal-binding membrane protein
MAEHRWSTGTGIALRPPAPPVAAVLLLIGAAWVAAVVLQTTGNAAALHHHALIEGEPGEAAPPPLWIGVLAFAVAWQLMIAAMMLPASLRAVGLVARSRLIGRPAAGIAGFLAAYSLVWTAFGLAAFAGDFVLHHIVDATPWLAERQWIIQASVLALAGAYQFLPARRRALEACRHPRATQAKRPGDAAVGFAIGRAHAMDCIVASWALMLLMFAAGVANLLWMAALATAMAYEALGRHGARFGAMVGVALLALAAAAALGVGLGF